MRGIDLDISEGSICALIGASGSGKTTTIGLLLGALTPDEGTAELFDQPAARLPANERRRLGYLPQQPVLYAVLSVETNLRFLASIWHVTPDAETMAATLDLVELTEHRHKRVREISGGMRRRLALAGCLVAQPSLLVLDEPTAGLDPILRQRFWDHFRTLADRGVGIVVATQYVHEAANCDRVGFIDAGALPYDESPNALLRRAYGGERVALEFARAVDDDLVHAMAGDTPGWVRHERRDGHAIDVVVDDAGRAIPALGAAAAGIGLDLVAADEVRVDWDDVFVTLVGRHRRAGADRDRINMLVNERIAAAIGPDETTSAP